MENMFFARDCGVTAHDLREIERLVFQHEALFLEKYHDYFNR